MKITATLREFREASDTELKERIAKLEEELFGHRMKRYTNQLENTMQIRDARRQIARAKMILSGRTKGTEKRASAQ